MNSFGNPIRIRRRIATMSLVFVVMSIGVAFAANKYSEEHLLERANDYWEARRVGDLHTIYQMETATVEGRMLPHQVPKAPFGRIKLVGYKFRDVKIQGDKARFVLDIEITIPELEGKSVTGPSNVDRWTFVEGDWYHGADRATLDAEKAVRSKRKAPEKQKP